MATDAARCASDRGRRLRISPNGPSGAALLRRDAMYDVLADARQVGTLAGRCGGAQAFQLRDETMESCDATFDNRFTRAFGFPVEKIRTKVRDYLPEPIKAFISESPFLVMSTCSPDGRCDASPKGGKPGFVRILDDRHLLVPDVAGNRLFQSYSNMEANPHVGLMFLIPGISEVVRVNGQVTMVSKDELDRHGVEDSMYNPNGNRDVLQGIVVEVEEAYGHCPRALTYADLWNTDTIRERRSSGRHPLRGAVPVPAAN